MRRQVGLIWEEEQNKQCLSAMLEKGEGHS